jgi:hypothetical protein
VLNALSEGGGSFPQPVECFDEVAVTLDGDNLRRLVNVVVVVAVRREIGHLGSTVRRSERSAYRPVMCAPAFRSPEAVLPWAGMDENAGDDSTARPGCYGRVARSDITRSSAAVSPCVAHGTRTRAPMARSATVLASAGLATGTTAGTRGEL